jgi:hypothetical protein
MSKATKFAITEETQRQTRQRLDTDHTGTVIARNYSKTNDRIQCTDLVFENGAYFLALDGKRNAAMDLSDAKTFYRQATYKMESEPA